MTDVVVDDDDDDQTCLGYTGGRLCQGGILPKNCKGVCGPLPKTLTLVMTKLCDFRWTTVTKKLLLKKNIKAGVQKLYPLYDQKGWKPNPLVLHISIYIPPAAHARICINVFMVSQIYHEEVNYDVLTSFGTDSDRLWLSLVTRLKCGFSWTRSLTFRATLRVAKV